MKANTFGLDIGSTSIKAVWLGKKDTSLYIESMIFSPTTSKWMLSDNPSEAQMLASSIKTMLGKAGITIREANISIPESQVYSKIIEMPDLSEQQLQAALKWEMEKTIPLPLEQVRTAWQDLERREKNGKKIIDILIVAAPIKLLEKYDKILQLAEVASIAVETEMISVHRAFLPIFNSRGADVIVHIGASTTDVAIVQNKVIRIVFSVPLGGIAITRAISSDFGIDVAQAENYKKTYGMTQNVFEGRIGKSLAPILESIISDIKKSILLFKEKNDNQEIQQMILSGGSALLPGIDIFFTNTLGIQVVVGNAWQINNILNVPQEALEVASSYNVVVGLGLRDLV